MDASGTVKDFHSSTSQKTLRKKLKNVLETKTSSLKMLSSSHPQEHTSLSMTGNKWPANSKKQMKDDGSLFLCSPSLVSPQPWPQLMPLEKNSATESICQASSSSPTFTAPSASLITAFASLKTIFSD